MAPSPSLLITAFALLFNVAQPLCPSGQMVDDSLTWNTGVFDGNGSLAKDGQPFSIDVIFYWMRADPLILAFSTAPDDLHLPLERMACLKRVMASLNQSAIDCIQVLQSKNGSAPEPTAEEVECDRTLRREGAECSVKEGNHFSNLLNNSCSANIDRLPDSISALRFADGRRVSTLNWACPISFPGVCCPFGCLQQQYKGNGVVEYTGRDFYSPDPLLMGMASALIIIAIIVLMFIFVTNFNRIGKEEGSIVPALPEKMTIIIFFEERF